MRPKFILLLLGSLLVLVVATPAAAQLKKVRFSVSAASIAEVPFRIANIKGFYRDEGLDVEVILIRGAVGMQALLGGSVDYTSASGSTIAAAVRGIPVKLVFIASAKPQFDLIAQPQIRSVADLKGKQVGISSRGGAVDLLTHLMIQKNGLVPNKDVVSLVVGGQEDTVLALRAGRIAAALLTPPRPLILQREGFHRIGYSGDYMPTYPSGGIGVTDEKIKTNPSDVLAFVKGSVRGLQFARQNRVEAKKIVTDYFSLKDPVIADQLFELYLNRLPVNGSADEVWMKGAIEFTQKSLGEASKEATINQ
ncbi:MAG: NitT/TauT family transport system substrate-binding protein, partial [Candidatus Binatota bacterium]|nr:NitT/TauT family transport system substrate-binding protein [Candidatus Binatota bacterium]